MQTQFLWLEAVELICIISISIVTGGWVYLLLKALNKLQYDLLNHNHVHSDKPFCLAKYVDSFDTSTISTLTLVQISMACYMYMDNPCMCDRCRNMITDPIMTNLHLNQL